MLFAYFVSAYFAVCVPCFSALAVCDLKGSQAPNRTAPLPPSFRATASHKQEPNSVTIAQPPLHVHTQTNLTWLECTWKEWQCSVSLSAVKHIEAFLPFQGMMQLVSRTAKHKHSCDRLSSRYARSQMEPFTAGQKVVLQYLLCIRGFGPQCFNISQGSSIYTNDFVLLVPQSIQCDDNNPAVVSFFNLYSLKYCVVLCVSS